MPNKDLLIDARLRALRRALAHIHAALRSVMIRDGRELASFDENREIAAAALREAEELERQADAS